MLFGYIVRLLNLPVKANSQREEPMDRDALHSNPNHKQIEIKLLSVHFEKPFELFPKQAFIQDEIVSYSGTRHTELALSFLQNRG